jgi:pyruvate kinase
MDIITTIGPSSWTEEIIKAHLRLGVICIRFPFAKETPEEHVERCKMVKRIATELGRDIFTMADLPGGKPRLSNLLPLEISSQKEYRIALSEKRGKNVDFYLDPSLTEDAVRAKEHVTIGDGENCFFIEAVENGIVTGRFEISGELERKRAFFPSGETLNIESVTEKDRKLARVASTGDFDWVAISFVDAAIDVINARKWLKTELLWEPKVVAKIETLGGTLRASEISSAADMVMIARGDLAVQVGFPYLWRTQKSIVDACKANATYTIAATGFLDQMGSQHLPSRSECVDICTALEMGVDAIMLSAETTIGKHPVKVVQVLRDIASAHHSLIL